MQGRDHGRDSKDPGVRDEGTPAMSGVAGVTSVIGVTGVTDMTRMAGEGRTILSAEPRPGIGWQRTQGLGWDCKGDLAHRRARLSAQRPLRGIRHGFAHGPTPGLAHGLTRALAQGSERLMLGLCVALVLLLVDGGAVQAQGGGQSYASRNACQSAGRFTATQCDNAFANAQAEFDEGTPRFAKRGDCEARFGRCQIASYGQGGVQFGPVMEAVVITDRGSNVTALPVMRGQRPPVPFAERTVQQRKAERSERKQKEAQKRWEALWAQPDAEAAAGGGADGKGGTGYTHEKPEAFDENWQKQEGVAKYPVPASRAKRNAP